MKSGARRTKIQGLRPDEEDIRGRERENKRIMPQIIEHMGMKT